MSRSQQPKRVSAPVAVLGSRHRPPQSDLEGPPPRRPSLSLLASPALQNSANPAQKAASRTSKTSQRHVVLPSEPQTRPLPHDVAEELTPARDVRSDGERMTKDERHRAGYPRLTAYSVADGLRMRHAVAFFKREHAVAPRVFDEAIYVMYHLPLLSGYAPNVNVRSSAAPQSRVGKSITTRMSEAEEYGYDSTYFPQMQEAARFSQDGFISTSPTQHRTLENVPEPQQSQPKDEEQVAEVIFFSYGVAVFFGLEEHQEIAILEDLESAGAWIRMRSEDAWEIEECHFVHDPSVAYPRIYNDFFTLKSHSHLLKISVAHALAQSTLLAHYESTASLVLLNSATMRIPKELATTGTLSLTRGEALRLTGRLFKLRTDVNLVSNVLDVPELFWSEASLKGLYDAVREYLEISPRVGVLNERLSVASDLLDLIHEHVNSGKMDRITWIIIWLIVIACLVELGEVVARLVVHKVTPATATTTVANPAAIVKLTREEALQALERVMLNP